MLYQLSYFRKNKPHQSMHPSFVNDIATPTGSTSGKRWIRTTEGVRQQIYSLPHLATLVTSQIVCPERTDSALHRIPSEAFVLPLPGLCGDLSPSSRRLSEPMEGFEPPTS